MCGTLVGGKDHVEGLCGLGEARQRHLDAGIEGVEEGLELGLVGMVADVAGIEELHGERAPGMPVGMELLRMEAVVEEASLAPHQMRVEVVGLEAVDDRRRLADSPPLEVEEGDTRRVVLIRSEDFA